MPVTPDPEHPMLRIIEELTLAKNKVVMIDEQENVTLVDTRPEHQIEENYVHLDRRAARRLLNFLDQALSKA